MNSEKVVDEYSLHDPISGKGLLVTSNRGFSFEEAGTTWKRRATAQKHMLRYLEIRAISENKHLPDVLRIRHRRFTIADLGYEDGEVNVPYIQAVARTLAKAMKARGLRTMNPHLTGTYGEIMETIRGLVVKGETFDYCIEATAKGEEPSIKIGKSRVAVIDKQTKVYLIAEENDFVVMRMALSGDIRRLYDFKTETVVSL